MRSNLSLCSAALVVVSLSASAYSAPKVRRNINSLSAAEITSLRAGVAAMKARPTNDPTSWRYQANMHGAPIADGNQPLWRQCQHGTSFFYAWHRMYLYYFERILRAASGSPNLTLPYWNYSGPGVTSLSIPTAFRLPANATNSLFESNRSAAMNAGGTLPLWAVDIAPAMASPDYYTSQNIIEGTPHGAVHVMVGGLMGSVPTAARDPIFWLHHCNIDRLWGAWFRYGYCRHNPTDASWLNQTYSFFDENKNMVTMTVSQILNTAAQLDYVYEEPGPPIFIWKFCWWKKIILMAKELPFRLPIPPEGLIRPITLDREVLEAQKKILSMGRQGDEVRQQIELLFEDAIGKEAPEAVFEVFAMPNPRASRRDWIKLGNLDFFGIDMPKGMAGHGVANEGHKFRRTFNLSSALADLEERGIWDGNLNLRLVPRAVLDVNGREIKPARMPSVEIGKVRIQVVEFQEQMK